MFWCSKGYNSSSSSKPVNWNCCGDANNFQRCWVDIGQVESSMFPQSYTCEHIWTYDTESNIYVLHGKNCNVFFFWGGCNPLVVRLHVQEEGIIVDCGTVGQATSISWTQLGADVLYRKCNTGLSCALICDRVVVPAHCSLIGWETKEKYPLHCVCMTHKKYTNIQIEYIIIYIYYICCSNSNSSSYSILYYSILFHSILFCFILFYSIFYSFLYSILFFFASWKHLSLLNCVESTPMLTHKNNLAYPLR